MRTLRFSNVDLTVDVAHGSAVSLCVGGIELLSAASPLFRFCLRHPDGAAEVFSSVQGAGAEVAEMTWCYEGFPGNAQGVSVLLVPDVEDGALQTRICVKNHTDFLVEWVEVLPLLLPALREEGGRLGGEMLYPFNEGALVDSMAMRQESWFPSMEPEYPSMGSFPVFPNMICSQMMAYLYDGENGRCGLYFGAHDEKRGVKAIDFRPADSGIEILFRYYCGVDYGVDYEADFPLVIRSFVGGWEAGAEIYRAWFENHLPPRLEKLSESDALPEWYEDNPLVITYPVRGIHDMDAPMHPNALYPYTNALPLVDEVAEKTGSRLLVLLMHWEGTAPWAPPYVWPAFGDPENFDRYLEALHDRNHLLGVYCSGFGYSIQSNLIDYNMQKEYDERGLEAAMCAGPDNKVQISRICTAQRSGYDICPASDLGKELLAEAYLPLLRSKVDYSQILDQNHGGSQYFCYSRDHGHAPAPGPWMTENMQELLGAWNDEAGKMLLGCESAAAEPFMGNLRFSDNRFELCYRIGRPVPLYAYLYHEYIRNFMGNQCCCPLPSEMDTLRYRMGYSFAVGDCMTMVFRPDGQLSPNWSTRDFDHVPDKEKALQFAANMTKFYNETAKPYLYGGRMIEGKPVECGTAPYGYKLPTIHSTAWEAEGKRVQILVNPFEEDETCLVGGEPVTVPANNAICLPL